jgi:hypothetical protein
VDGTLAGKEIRKSLGLRDWQKAQDIVRQWEAEGQRSAQTNTEPLTIERACEQFLRDAEAQ